MQVAAIGLAGENRVYMASIDHNHASASRGVGVIMGDKRLKAIAVRGTKDVNVAKPTRNVRARPGAARQDGRGDGNGDWMAVDEDDSFHHNHFAWGNARTRRKNFWSPELQERWTEWKYDHMDRQTGCFNCPKKCRNVINWPGEPRFGYKCFGKDTYHMAAFLELDFTYEILGVAQEYGLDSYSTPQVIAFALELLEEGILKRPGLSRTCPPTARAASSTCSKRSCAAKASATSWPTASRRRRSGSARAPRTFDHNTTKKFEQLPIKLGKLNPAYFLMIATGEKMSITQIEGSFPQDPLPTQEQREDFVSKWEAPPDEKFKKYFLEWKKRDDISDEATCEIVDWNEAMHYIDDSTRAVRLRVLVPRPVRRRASPYHMNNIPQIISACDRAGGGQGAAVEDVPANPHPGAGGECSARPAPQGRTPARRPLGGARRRLRTGAAHQVLRVQGLEQRGHSEPGDAGTAGSGLRGRGPGTKADPDAGRGRVRPRISRNGGADPGAHGRIAMKADVATKTVKEIIADIDKCTGCRACEMACSAFHAKPRYSSINPARSRIRVVTDEINDEYVPVRAGNFTPHRVRRAAFLPAQRQAIW